MECHVGFKGFEMNKRKITIVAVVTIVALLFIVSVVLLNSKYVVFRINADIDGKPANVCGVSNYFKCAVDEWKLAKCFSKTIGNEFVVADFKIKDNRGSKYHFDVFFDVDGKTVIGSFDYFNTDKGISDTWDSTTNVHFYYKDQVLCEDITCSDGVVTDFSVYPDGNFDVTICK